MRHATLRRTSLRPTSLLLACLGMFACGNDGITPSSAGAGSDAIDCEALDPFVCERSHGDLCSATKRAVIDQELGCHSDAFVEIHCSPTSECANTEQIARSAEGLISLIRGCLDGTSYTTIEAPSAALRTAATVSCRDSYFLDDESCREFSPESCPSGSTHCRIAEGHLFRPAKACIDPTVTSPPECRVPRSGLESTLVEDLKGGLWVFSPQDHWPIGWKDVHLDPSVNFPGFSRIGPNTMCSN